MKYFAITLCYVILCITGSAQEAIKEITKEKADSLTKGIQPVSYITDSSGTTPPTTPAPIENLINKGIDFGISLGFNRVFNKVYEAQISPLDNKLQITNEPATSFLLSTGLSVALSKGKFGGRYYRKMDNGRPYGSVYFVPYGLCLIATVNLVTFNSAANGGLFNKRLDGGLGLGYKVNENLQLSLTYEMISYRQPQQFLIDRKGEVLTVNSKELTALDTEDKNFFHDKYFPSLSFKFFYLIKTGNKVK